MTKKPKGLMAGLYAGKRGCKRRADGGLIGSVMKRGKRRGSGLTALWSSGGKHGAGSGMIPSTYSGKAKGSKLLMRAWGALRRRRRQGKALQAPWGKGKAAKGTLIAATSGSGRRGRRPAPGSLQTVVMDFVGRGKRGGRNVAGGSVGLIAMGFYRLIFRQMEDPAPMQQTSPDPGEPTTAPPPQAPLQRVSLLARLREAIQRARGPSN